MKWLRNKFGKAGFKLVELLVVIAVITFLSSMLIPALQQARKKAKYACWIGDMRQSNRMDPYCLPYFTFEKDTVKVGLNPFP